MTNEPVKIDSAHEYLDELVFEVNQNYIVKLSSTTSYQWALQLGNAHSHEDENLSRIATSFNFVFYLSADSVHVVNKTTGAVVTSAPGRQFDSAYDPLWLAFDNDADRLYIVTRRISDNIILISSVPAADASMTFDFSDTKSLTGVTATRAIMDMALNSGTGNYNAALATGGGGHVARIILFTYSGTLSFTKIYELAVSDTIGLSVGSLSDTLGYKNQATGDYCLFNYDTSGTYAVEYFYWFSGYDVIGISRLLSAYAFTSDHKVLKFTSLFRNFTVYTLSDSSQVANQVPGIYRDSNTNLYFLNLVSGTEATFMFGEGWSTVFRYTTDNVVIPATNQTAPSSASNPSSVTVSGITIADASDPTSVTFSMTADAEWSTSLQLIDSTVTEYQATTYNNVSGTTVSSIYCDPATAGTGTLSFTSAPSWLSYDSATDTMSGVMTDGLTSLTTGMSLAYSDGSTLSNNITITFNSWTDANCAQCSNNTECESCASGYSIDTGDPNVCTLDPVVPPVTTPTPTPTPIGKLNNLVFGIHG